jgi:glycosyltransferase involved in cell wall biosynthesis
MKWPPHFMPDVKPKLWIISELFYPEQTSTGYFLTEIAKGLVDDMDVHVVCGQPTYSEHGMKAPRREHWRGMSIFRLPATSFRKDRLVLRAINTVTLTISALIYLLLHVRRNDKILLVTNPPTFTPIVALVSKLTSARPFLLVHDVYPEILRAAGFLSPKSVFYRLLDRLMRVTFRVFEKIIVLGHDMQTLICQKTGYSEDRVIIITNWADHEEIIPLSDDRNIFAEANNLQTKTVIQFSGNIGRTHDIESLLVAAFNTQDRTDIQYLVAGYGGKAKAVQKQLAESRAGNILFLDRQPRELLGAMLSSATAIVVPFTSQMKGLSVPSRMYNILAAGTPIIAMADPESELAMMVSCNDAGWVIAPHDAGALTQLILQISTPEGLREAKRLGQCGRRVVCERYTLAHVIQNYRQLLLADV